MGTSKLSLNFLIVSCSQHLIMALLPSFVWKINYGIKSPRCSIEQWSSSWVSLLLSQIRGPWTWACKSRLEIPLAEWPSSDWLKCLKHHPSLQMWSGERGIFCAGVSSQAPWINYWRSLIQKKCRTVYSVQQPILIAVLRMSPPWFFSRGFSVQRVPKGTSFPMGSTRVSRDSVPDLSASPISGPKSVERSLI